MGLMNNGVYAEKLNFLSGNVACFSDKSKRITNSIQNALTYGSQYVSYPVGYYEAAFYPAIKVGGMACRLSASGNIMDVPLTGKGNLEAVLTAVGTISNANLAGGVNLSATLTGEGTLSSAVKGLGHLSCNINILAQPTSVDIAQTVWSSLMSIFTAEGTFGKQIQKLLTLAKFLGLK